MKTRNSRHTKLSLLLSLFLLGFARTIPVVAQGTFKTEIVAQQYATAEAPGAILPFAADGGRYMMIYQGGLFSPAMKDGALITQIAFRVDGPDGGQLGGGNIVSAVLPDIEIHMSTSQAPPISSQPPVDAFGRRNFAPNVGADDTIVFQRGSLNWRSSWSSTGPNPFALTVPLSKSFQYNPAAGSLVIDMYIYSRSSDGLRLDAAPADALYGDVSGPAGTPQSAAMIQLTYFPIPEPSTYVLIVTGVLFILAHQVFFKP